jgi:hypothetical protein
MILPRRSTSGNRPAYLDNLFRDAPPLPSQSLHSANSSISESSVTSPFSIRPSQPLPRPLSPAVEDVVGEQGSVRSLRLNLSPRHKIRNIFNRRTPPQVEETLRPPSPVEAQRQPRRRKSLPLLQTSFSQPLPRPVQDPEKPLPDIPPPLAQELNCHRCYYFAARNCNGWVL